MRGRSSVAWLVAFPLLAGCHSVASSGRAALAVSAVEARAVPDEVASALATAGVLPSGPDAPRAVLVSGTSAPPTRTPPAARPTNLLCPVMTGIPVDPSFTSVWQGKVVGFSSDVAKRHWDADPASFARNLSVAALDPFAPAAAPAPASVPAPAVAARKREVATPPAAVRPAATTARAAAAPGSSPPAPRTTTPTAARASAVPVAVVRSAAPPPRAFAPPPAAARPTAAPRTTPTRVSPTAVPPPPPVTVRTYPWAAPAVGASPDVECVGGT
jgi:hypothetical protein